MRKRERFDKHETNSRGAKDVIFNILANPGKKEGGRGLRWDQGRQDFALFWAQREKMGYPLFIFFCKKFRSHHVR